MKIPLGSRLFLLEIRPIRICEQAEGSRSVLQCERWRDRFGRRRYTLTIAYADRQAAAFIADYVAYCSTARKATAFDLTSNSELFFNPPYSMALRQSCIEYLIGAIKRSSLT